MREEAFLSSPGSLISTGYLSSRDLAVTITRAASKQTYFTIKYLADRDRVSDAFQAYAYFRWLDDAIDGQAGSRDVSRAFLDRQKALLERAYAGLPVGIVHNPEAMLVDLIQGDQEVGSGLQIYLRNMMQVMDFDASRRGRLVSRAELNQYTLWLASAVTEAMHYFVGHAGASPHDDTRYLAVTGAHIVHMLRDTLDDLRAGYFNIPLEVLEAGHFGPHDIHSGGYRSWVKSRVELARRNLRAGREYLARVEEPRCRLAGSAYITRFEELLGVIEADDYALREIYSEPKGATAGLRLGVHALLTALDLGTDKRASDSVASHGWRRP